MERASWSPLFSFILYGERYGVWIRRPSFHEGEKKRKRKKRLVKRGRRIFRFDYVRVALTRLRVLIAPYPKQENSTSPPLYIRQLYYNCPITRAYNSFRFAFASRSGKREVEETSPSVAKSTPACLNINLPSPPRSKNGRGMEKCIKAVCG